jgi:hypothetical protein
MPPSRSGERPGAYEEPEWETYLAWVESDWPFTVAVDGVVLDTLLERQFKKLPLLIRPRTSSPHSIRPA